MTALIRRTPILLRLLLGIAFFLAGTPTANAGTDEEPTHRIEGSYSLEYLTPHSTYGDWHTGNLSYYSRPTPDFTYFLQGSFYDRKEGDGGVGVVGAYKDWTSWLYTYTALSGGTNTVFLPRFRGDQDFNFKVGRSKQIVLTAGATFVDYYNGHQDLIISGGPAIYLNRWYLQYRLFRNQSNPGDVSSYSHLFSVAYGEEHWQRTTLSFSFGKQAYLASSLATPEAINSESYYVNLEHRHWLGKYYGILAGASFFKLNGGYDKTGVTFGLFYEF